MSKCNAAASFRIIGIIRRCCCSVPHFCHEGWRRMGGVIRTQLDRLSPNRSNNQLRLVTRYQELFAAWPHKTAREQLSICTWSAFASHAAPLPPHPLEVSAEHSFPRQRCKTINFCTFRACKVDTGAYAESVALSLPV